MKPISLLTACLLCFSLVFVSCKPNKKKDNTTKTQTEATSDNTNTETLTQNLITENVGKYPREIKVFDDGDLGPRLKQLAGDLYTQIRANFQTQSPVVTLDGIYKFTGCKQHDCPAFHTTILYDAKDDNFNIIVSRKGKVTVFDEKGKITMTKALQEK